MWTDVVTALGGVPKAAMAYMAHIEDGVPIRALARAEGCHASTILRQVRQIEQRRDDPLIDQALRQAASRGPAGASRQNGGITLMTDQTRPAPRNARDLAAETYRILGRMAESGACLALAAGMENAVVVREIPDAEPVRTATVPRAIAEALAMNDWIRVKAQGRITRYEISTTGRAALKRAASGDADDAFADQHREIEERDMPGKGRVRYNAAESPLVALARRRDRDGKPFLPADLVRAGETLREDFELAQMGPRVTQNWEKFMTGGAGRGLNPSDRMGTGPDAARSRVQAALEDLGPGLGDVVLRACCFLEGMESIEKRMGWAARSGKIVLRIGLQRLLRHYDERHGGVSPLIG